MNVDRLNKLANLLDTVPPEKFDLNYWGLVSKVARVPNTLDISKDECGTVACACGWACTIPEFREAGLYLGRTAMLSYSSEYVLKYTTTSLTVPVGKVTYQGIPAAARFFAISEDQAEDLFYSSSYFAVNNEDEDAAAISPAMVAARIRKLIAVEGPDHAD